MIGAIECTYNNTSHSAFGGKLTPNEVFYLAQPRLLSTTALDRLLRTDWTGTGKSAAIVAKDIRRIVKVTLKLARDQQAKLIKRVEKADKGHLKTPTFKRGERVLLVKYETGRWKRKLLGRASAGYVVVRMLQKGRNKTKDVYTIQCVATGERKNVNVDRMRPFHFHMGLAGIP